jgi:hypothetical protein
LDESGLPNEEASKEGVLVSSMPLANISLFVADSEIKGVFSSTG